MNDAAIPSPTLVIGVGASAGGLDACKALLEQVPRHSRLAFIVVLHLDPTHTSHLAELLQTATHLTVSQVADSERLQPDHVYVIAPDTELTMHDGVLQVDRLKRKQTRGQLIDTLFTSLANIYGDRATGVILSGTGTDGTRGLKQIKAANGLCLVQEPLSATHDGMPRSAIEANLADGIFSPANMASVLLDFANTGTRPLLQPVEPVADLFPPGEANFARILALMASHFDVDFAAYKEGTLQRRAERRRKLNNLADWDAYLGLLRKKPAELEALYQDILIGVTSFFRDPEVWQQLTGELPELLDQSQDPTVRAWAAGCATGEEAYSLAIVLHEMLTNTGRPKPQIYATDLNSAALATARRGTYPTSIAADISEDRLKQFFRANGGRLQIDPRIRETVTFSPHNLIADAPFSRMDLVCCRNLMIYLKPDEQDRIFERLHFSLRPGGLLLLGRSETASYPPGLFDTISKPLGLYRARATTGKSYHLSKETPHNITVEHSVPERPSREQSVQRHVEQFVLSRRTPACVVINQGFEIRHFFGPTQDYLAAPTGRTRLDLFSWLRPGFYAGLRSGLMQAVKKRQPATIDGQVRSDDSSRYVSCMIEPIPEMIGEDELFLISFRDLERVVPEPAFDVLEAGEPLARQLEAELLDTRRELLAALDQFNLVDEEHRAGHEEMLSLNEELQSTNEELQASKEEMQSLNEELSTINHELEEKNAELRTANTDLDNLLSSPGVPTLFLDRALNIRRFTATASEVMHILPSDVGRSIEHVKMRFVDTSLADDARAAIATLSVRATQIKADDGEIFIRQSRPYRAADGAVEGICITFENITSQQHLITEAQTAREYSEAIVNTVRTPLIVFDHDLSIVSANPSFCDLLQAVPQDLAGKNLSIAGDHVWNVEKLRQLLEEILSTKNVVVDYEIRNDNRILLSNAYKLQRPGQTPLILMSIEDVTERRRASEVSVRYTEELAGDLVRKDEWIAMLGHELRNPLAAIISGLDLLAQADAGDSVASQRAVQKMMQRNSQHLRVRLDALLDAARLVSGKIHITFELVDLIQIADDVIESFRGTIAQKQLTLSLSRPPKATFVLGDPTRLTQIIENLLSNAIEFTPTGGQLTVVIQAKANSVSLTVGDSGIGMTAELIKEIFSVFSQGPQALDRPRQGLGLGLPLVQRFVELHNGRIEVFSAGEGQGSSFEISLPRIQEPVRPDVKPLIAPLAARRILIVDDEPDAAAALVEVLQLQGHVAKYAADGPRALQTAATLKPEVALLDLGLPGMDGYMLASELRRQYGGITLIALSGYQKNARRCREAGFDDHFTKPLSMPALSKVLANSPGQSG